MTQVRNRFQLKGNPGGTDENQRAHGFGIRCREMDREVPSHGMADEMNRLDERFLDPAREKRDGIIESGRKGSGKKCPVASEPDQIDRSDVV